MQDSGTLSPASPSANQDVSSARRRKGPSIKIRVSVVDRFLIYQVQDSFISCVKGQNGTGKEELFDTPGFKYHWSSSSASRGTSFVRKDCRMFKKSCGSERSPPGSPHISDVSRKVTSVKSVYGLKGLPASSSFSIIFVRCCAASTELGPTSNKPWYGMKMHAHPKVPGTPTRDPQDITNPAASRAAISGGWETPTYQRSFQNKPVKNRY